MSLVFYLDGSTEVQESVFLFGSVLWRVLCRGGDDIKSGCMRCHMSWTRVLKGVGLCVVHVCYY